MSFITTTAQGVVIRIHAVPGARKTAVAGLHGDSLKIKLGAPPVDGKANRELLDFLAHTLELRKSCVTLLSGDMSREKRVLVANLDAGVVEQKLSVT